MTTAPQPRQVKVEGTGKTKKGSRFFTTSAWFKSEYPVTVYLKDGQGEGLREGDTVTIVRGNLHAGKTGQYESDYYYDLVETVLPSAGGYTAPQPQQPATAAPVAKVDVPAPPRAVSTNLDVRQWRSTAELNRVDALKAANDFVIAQGNESYDALRVRFDYYLALLETGEAPMTGEEAGDGSLPF